MFQASDFSDSHERKSASQIVFQLFAAYKLFSFDFDLRSKNELKCRIVEDDPFLPGYSNRSQVDVRLRN